MNGIKDLFKPGKLVTAPGIFDGISARIADPFKFELLYMTGYGTVASHLGCLLYTSPSPRDKRQSRMPSSA